MIVAYNLDELQDFLEKGLKFREIFFNPFENSGGGAKDTLAPQSEFWGEHAPPAPPLFLHPC